MTEPMTPDVLQTLLQEAFPDADVATAGEGNKFDLRIVDASFDGKRLVARQQAVYAVLNDYIASGVIHAVNIQALTPDEWKQQSRFG